LYYGQAQCSLIQWANWAIAQGAGNLRALENYL